MPDFQAVSDCDCEHPKCLGVKYWAECPYMTEIHGDRSPVFECDGQRWESAQDI